MSLERVKPWVYKAIVRTGGDRKWANSRSREPGADAIDYMNGTLWVDEFVTHHQQLENINKGFDDMHAGDCIRCVVNMGQGTD